MKKIVALILTFMFIATLGINTLALDAAPESYKNFEIPKATDRFTIGDFDTAKWNGALVYTMDASNSWPAMDGDNNDFEGAVFYFAWAVEGIYFYADIKNKNDVSVSAPAPDEAHNRGNGLQFFPAMEAANDLPGWTFHPYTTDGGKASVWEHWPINDISADAKIFAQTYSGGYILEGLMPATTFASPDTTFGGVTIAEGFKFAMLTVCLQAPEEGVHMGWADGGWFTSPDEYPSFTLVGKVIEGVPPPAPEPEPEPDVPAPADETPAPAPAPEPAPVVVPQTGNSTIILSMLAIFGITVIFVKKSKSRV